MMTNTRIMAAITVNMMMTRHTKHRDLAVWERRGHDFRAMNTDIHLTVLAPAQKRLAARVEESFRYFEQLLSRFRPASELCRLNDCHEPAFRAGLDFYEAVEAALWAAQQTHGIYDPTILSYLEEAGYDRTFGAVANPRPLFDSEAPEYLPAAKPAADGFPNGYDYRHFDLDPFSLLISRPAGLRIDLGGMGKGWTVDRVADDLCREGHFLLNAGGDLYAYGTPGGEQGWEIHLGHPKIPALKFATMMLDHHAVATSTTARRRWLKDGIVQHHLIDPRSGCPADTDVVSVSVVAGRAFTAEIYAKAALILGAAEGLAFLESLPDVEGALFTSSDHIHLTSGMDQYITRLDPSGY
jgi:FAD:protein FMN transferase